MTDDQLLACLKDAERCMDRTRSHRDALNQLDRATRGRVDDRDQRRALDEVLRELSRGSARKLDETIDALQTYLQQESRSSLRQHEKMIRFAENYGADSKTLDRLRQQAMQDILNVSFPPGMTLDSALGMPLTQQTTMNQQTIDNAQAALDKAIADKAKAIADKDKAIADKAKADADKAKSEHIEYLKTLANATLHLLNAASGGALSDSGQRVMVKFRKELQPLALELGYRIVFTGDCTTAVLVQA